MPEPISICLEDLCTGRFTACVAVAPPALGVDPAGRPLWRTRKDLAFELRVSGDDRLVLVRPPGAAASTVRRGGRGLEVPVDQPVVLLHGDEIEVPGARLRVHVHGPARRVSPPRPLPASSVPSRLAVGALAVSAIIEVRCSPPKMSDSGPYPPEEPCAFMDPDLVDFGEVGLPPDTPSRAVVSISNPCDADLDIEGITLVPADAPFRVGRPDAVVVPPGGTSEMTVSFVPEEPGTWEARIVLTAWRLDEPVEVFLRGTALVPAR